MTAPLLYVLAALASGLAYSLTDVSRKLLMGRIRPLPALCVLSWGAVPLFLVWWLRAGVAEIPGGYWLPGGVSVVLNIVANLAFFEAVRRSPLSVTIPMLSLTPVFTTLLALVILGEVPTPRQALGIGLVVAGALLINLSDGDRIGVGELWRALRREPGTLIMAGVALAWSLATPLDKLAMAEAGVPFHALVLHFGVGLGAFAALALRRGLRELLLPRGTRWVALASLLAGAVAIACFLIAITHLWVGLVESLKRAVGSAAALALGSWLFDESIGALRIWAVVLMSAGVGLILI